MAGGSISSPNSSTAIGELHVEFNVAKNSNSGVYFQGQYEVQNPRQLGKADKDLKYGDCGGIYNTAAPNRTPARCPASGSLSTLSSRPRASTAPAKKTASARFVKVVHNASSSTKTSR